MYMAYMKDMISSLDPEIFPPKFHEPSPICTHHNCLFDPPQHTFSKPKRRPSLNQISPQKPIHDENILNRSPR